MFKSPIYPLIFSFNYLKGRRWLIYGIIAASVISTAARLLVPVLIGDIIDSIKNANYSSVYSEIYLILIMAVVSSIASFGVNYGSQYTSQVYAYNLRKKLVNKMFNKKYQFFEGQVSGDLLSKTTMDVDASRNFIMNTLSSLIPTIIMIVFAIIYLFILYYVFAIIFALSLPFIIFIGIVFQRKQRTHWRNIRELYGHMNEKLTENIAGQRTIRSYMLENEQIKSFKETTDGYYNEYMEVAHLRGFYNNLMPFIIGLAATATIIVGSYNDIILHGQIGNLVGAVNIFTLVAFPVSFLGRLIVFSENARAAIGRINDVLTENGDEVIVDKNDFKLGNDIVMQSVNYKRGDRTILRDINLSVNSGEFVCITGETGSGKSTLVGMLTKLIEPNSGTIKIGGLNINSIPLGVLRKRVSIVPQESNLISGTIMENIKFGRADIPDSVAIEAARIAGIDDFVESLPEKYDTVVGERGITLSGGQKQRLTLARAIASKPGVLILDDATSSVDAETELKIFTNIKKAIVGITVIIVSLRYSSMKYADTLYELKDGVLHQIEFVEEMK